MEPSRVEEKRLYWPRLHQGEPRFCHRCEEEMDGPDSCFGYIPGVSHACCGHGDHKYAYVVIGGSPDQDCTTIDDYLVLRGEEAIFFFALVDCARIEIDRLMNTPPWERK